MGSPGHRAASRRPSRRPRPTTRRSWSRPAPPPVGSLRAPRRPSPGGRRTAPEAGGGGRTIVGTVGSACLARGYPPNAGLAIPNNSSSLGTQASTSSPPGRPGALAQSGQTRLSHRSVRPAAASGQHGPGGVRWEAVGRGGGWEGARHHAPKLALRRATYLVELVGAVHVLALSGDGPVWRVEVHLRRIQAGRRGAHGRAAAAAARQKRRRLLLHLGLLGRAENVHAAVATAHGWQCAAL